jgi:hypothetical protein
MKEGRKWDGVMNTVVMTEREELVPLLRGEGGRGECRIAFGSIIGTHNKGREKGTSKGTLLKSKGRFVG